MERDVLQRLSRALGSGAALHVVGGWVRDRCLEDREAPAGLVPKGAVRPSREGDLDLATALLPKEVMARARAAGLKAVPTGLPHGTVTVILEGRPVEITTFRGEGEYLDGRRPSSVTLGVDLEQDLARRDFTVNALALPLEAVGDPAWRGRLVDPFGGLDDLERRLIRAVGDPLARFAEDGLRPLRACRFASQLGFDVDAPTLAAIPPRLEVCAKVALERVFTELTKLICSRNRQAARGLRMLESTGLLDLWMPELRPMVGCAQNRHHRFDVWEHTLKAMELVPYETPAAAWGLLLHDAGKPPTRSLGEEGEVHFYDHEAVSEHLAESLLRRLRAPNRLREKALSYIRLHGVHPGVDWTDAAYRRLLKRIVDAGLEPESWERFQLADRWGKGWFEVGHPDGRSGEAWWQDTQAFWSQARQRLEAVRFPGMTPRELALDGNALMVLAGRPGGPWLGELQAWLLEQIIEDPGINTAEGLRRRCEAYFARVDRTPN